MEYKSRLLGETWWRKDRIGNGVSRMKAVRDFAQHVELRGASRDGIAPSRGAIETAQWKKGNTTQIKPAHSVASLTTRATSKWQCRTGAGLVQAGVALSGAGTALGAR